MPDRVVTLLLAGAVALLLASAAWHKLRALAGFRAILEGYRLLPAAALPAVGLAVPLIELLVAAGVLVDGTRRIAALAAAVLLLGYALAIGINLRRGRRDVSCGCGRAAG